MTSGSVALNGVASGAVTTAPGDEHDDDQEDEDESDDRKHLHPPWCAGLWLVLLSHVGHVAALFLSRVPGYRSPAGPGIYRHDVSCVSGCPRCDVAYTSAVPKLWNETIEAHRREVRDAILDTTAELVAEHGLRSVTMSQIAEDTGIGRATLYRYFSDVDAILLAWHERQIAGHLGFLAEVRDQAVGPRGQLEAVLESYALISHETHGHHDSALAAFLHRDKHVARAQEQLHAMVRDLLVEGVESGDFRDDVAPEELATYCLHAVSEAGRLPSKGEVRRLISVTLAGLRPPA